jgi:hypothetical protein
MNKVENILACYVALITIFVELSSGKCIYVQVISLVESTEVKK